MFQNIKDKVFKNTKEGTKNSILANIISKKYVLLYIISFMVSTVSMGQDVSPFSLAIVTAAAANEIPIVGIIIVYENIIT